MIAVAMTTLDMAVTRVVGEIVNFPLLQRVTNANTYGDKLRKSGDGMSAARSAERDARVPYSRFPRRSSHSCSRAARHRGGGMMRYGC